MGSSTTPSSEIKLRQLRWAEDCDPERDELNQRRHLERVMCHEYRAK